MSLSNYIAPGCNAFADNLLARHVALRQGRRPCAVMSLKLLLASLFAVLLLRLSLAEVRAHSIQVIRTEPEVGATLQQGPQQITLIFAEELMSPASRVQVFNAAGQPVDLGDGGVDLTDPDHAALIVHLPALGEDLYTVRWQVELNDGDLSAGSFDFTIGAGVRSHTTVAATVPVSLPLPSTVLWLSAGGVLLAAASLGLFWRRRLV